MKTFVIGNVIYLPIEDSNKYIKGSINGTLFINEIYTEEEIREKHSTSSFELIESKSLDILVDKWRNS